MGCAIDTASVGVSYTYDAVGNLSGSGNTLGAGDQMATAVVTPAGTVYSYTYDADGNVTTRTNTSTGVTYSYTWSSDNRLLSGGVTSGTANIVNFDYDALGRPVVKRGRDGKIERVTLYDGSAILADLDSAGHREAEYVYDAGTDRPYAMLTGASAVTGAQYFVQDVLGNVKGTVYDSVNTASTVTYSDWGVPSVTGDTTNRLSWKGLSYDPDLGLTYMRARWYDPSLGRFVSEDPLGLQAGINPYLFANDDPINGFDPSGMKAGCQELYYVSMGDASWDSWQDTPSLACLKGGSGITFTVTGLGTPPLPSPDSPMQDTGGGGASGGGGPPGTVSMKPNQLKRVLQAIRNLKKRPACRQLADAAAKFYPKQFYFDPRSQGDKEGYYQEDYHAIVLLPLAFQQSRARFQGVIAHQRLRIPLSI